MFVSRVSEAIPLSVTALIPLVLNPLCGLGTSNQIAKSYFNGFLQKKKKIHNVVVAQFVYRHTVSLFGFIFVGACHGKVSVARTSGALHVDSFQNAAKNLVGFYVAHMAIVDVDAKHSGKDLQKNVVDIV